MVPKPLHLTSVCGGQPGTDLLPTPASKRTFAAADFAALWVTLVISITTYYLAASLVDMGERQQQQQQQQRRQVH
jgi:cytosine/uracil/thiamine/allantoin permease